MRVLSTLHARLRAHRAPGIPCALIFRRPEVHDKPHANLRRDREAVSSLLPRPVLTGRGRGVGLPPRAVFLESAPHPPGFAEASGAPSRDPVASPADLSPQER